MVYSVNNNKNIHNYHLSNFLSSPIKIDYKFYHSCSLPKLRVYPNFMSISYIFRFQNEFLNLEMLAATNIL